MIFAKTNKSWCSNDMWRWWLVALCVALVGTGLVALLWNFPTSRWVWAFAIAILIFVFVAYFNPRYRLWRRASACFAMAAVLAFTPSFTVKANLEGIGAIEFVSESSPILVLGFLGAGLFMAWLDARQQTRSPATAGGSSTNTNLNAVHSPHAITGLAAGGHILINQGISEDTLLAAIDARQIRTVQDQSASPSEPHEGDEDLVWHLVDDIKAARRRFEREEATKLLCDLKRCFGRCGDSWPKTLRTEVILLFAEEERSRISQARAQGRETDLTRLQALLEELHGVGT